MHLHLLAPQNSVRADVQGEQVRFSHSRSGSRVGTRGLPLATAFLGRIAKDDRRTPHSESKHRARAPIPETVAEEP